MTYIVENNGCYGLTKGQDSATADVGSKSKKGTANPYEPIDLVSVAIQLGATFVARSFSGDRQQLVPLIKAALSHKGFAFLDVISPCVTFNNHEGSTKSYAFTRDHLDPTPVDFVPMREEIRTSYAAGATQEVCLHDGSVIRLFKQSNEYDVEDPQAALGAIARHNSEGRVLTGLLYLDRDAQELHEILETTRRPLNTLTEKELCPGSKVLDSINAGLR